MSTSSTKLKTATSWRGLSLYQACSIYAPHKDKVQKVFFFFSFFSSFSSHLLLCGQIDLSVPCILLLDITHLHSNAGNGRRFKRISSLLERLVVPTPTPTPIPRSKIDPRSIQDRSKIDPGSIQNRFRIDPGSTQDRPKIDPRSIQDRSKIDPRSIQDRSKLVD